MSQFQKRVFHNLPMGISSVFSPDGKAASVLFDGLSLALTDKDLLQDSSTISFRLPLEFERDEEKKSSIKLTFKGFYSSDGGNGFIFYQLGKEKASQDLAELVCQDNQDWAIERNVEIQGEELLIHIALFGDKKSEADLIATLDSIDIVFAQTNVGTEPQTA